MPSFEETIINQWAGRFQCAASVMQQRGTSLLPDEKYAHKQMIDLWHIGEHTFGRYDPAYAGLMDGMMADLPAKTALSGSDIQDRLPANAILSHDVDFFHYLRPADLPEFTPPQSFSVRQLGPADREDLSALHSHCTPEEVDNAFVEVDHEIAFGCFSGDELAAAASGYRMTGFMDIGVLTHKRYRKLGLGKAVVGALCAWSIAHEVIAQYRCDAHNSGSLGVARTLKFQLFFRSETIVLA